MYRPASDLDEVEVGGDFYDFFETPAGWIVLLGDVTGRGVDAAAMTSLVRHGARFLAKHEHRPSQILADLDEALREQPGVSLCSAICARLGPGGIEISSAGHPSPLIVRDDGRIRELGGSGKLVDRPGDRGRRRRDAVDLHRRGHRHARRHGAVRPRPSA